MGRCSATEVFDPIAEYILNTNDLSKTALLKVIIQALEAYDWDCQSDSLFYDHSVVQSIFRELHPDWFEEEDDNK